MLGHSVDAGVSEARGRDAGGHVPFLIGFHTLETSEFDTTLVTSITHQHCISCAGVGEAGGGDAGGCAHHARHHRTHAGAISVSVSVSLWL